MMARWGSRCEAAVIAWYNEIDPFSARWLRNLIAAGHLPSGPVDERSIVEVGAGDVPGTAHFFAGIGGWPLALRLAGWPDDLPVWTGSCPCQPFSAAGKRLGADDPRHLWPAWFRLIRKSRPVRLFGEQVGGRAGRAWLSGVQADLESVGYTFGACDLPAAGVGAPHIRQRLFWVADSDGWFTGDGRVQRSGRHLQRPEDEDARGMADSQCGRFMGSGANEREHAQAGRSERPHQNDERELGEGRSLKAGWIGDSIGPRLQGQRRQRGEGPTEGHPSGRAGSWSGALWLPCADGKARRVPDAQSGVRPLAHGVPGRVGRLRAYGNAIIPQVAAEFVRAYMEARA